MEKFGNSETPTDSEVEGVNPAQNLESLSMREAVRLERTGHLAEIRSHLMRLRPILTDGNRTHLFRTWRDDNDIQVLLTTDGRLAQQNDLAVIINKERSAIPGEPFYPNGVTLQIMDAIVPRYSRWFNASFDTLHRRSDHFGWGIPRFATVIRRAGDNQVRLYGQYASGSVMQPVPAGNLEGIKEYNSYYWDLSHALSYCNEVTLEEDVTEITTD